MFSLLTQMIPNSDAYTSPVTDALPSEVLAPAAEHVAHHAEEAFSVTSLINHHLSDAVLWPLQIGGFDMSITKRVVMMWVVSFLMLAIFIPAARFIVRKVYSRPGRFSGAVEMLVGFVRNGIAADTMGKDGKAYVPYLLTLFFFILFSNLLGLFPPMGELVQFVGVQTGMAAPMDAHVPATEAPLALKLWPGITSTGDLSVTGALAGISLLVIFVSGFAFQGIAFVKNIVPKGIPAPLWILMWPLEFIGIFTKAFALAVRLLANMTAGHMLLLVLMGFIFQYQNYGVAAASYVGSVGIFMLELLVAFLQAYIFVLLTALFVAGAQHRH